MPTASCATLPISLRLPESTGVACTEVALNPAEVAAALDDPTIFPTPLAGTEGPDWIVIGTEGGFLPGSGGSPGATDHLGQ